MKKRHVPARSTRTFQRLRRRLQEAEDTIRAIREGHVEALVIDSPTGEQIYTLRSADQPYRLMVEQMREGAITVGADSTVLYCNTRFSELIGLPSERITGQQLRCFVMPEDLPQLEVMLNAETFRYEFQLRTASGTPLPAQVSATTMAIDGIRTVAVVVTDLTHERIERGLRESNRLKDEFLATLSHELRTPLNVILGWTRMLLANQLQDTVRRHALELIDRNAQAQAQLVNDLVDMSRMTTGKLRLDLEPLPIVPILETALESVRLELEAKNLHITTVWDAPELTVMGDATRLQQVLWNLLSNAIKFTPTAGQITVGATRLDDRIRIEIADSGVGLDPAFLPHVFERFRQAESGTTRRFGGLGLGLAIVQDLVRLHKGTVEAHSAGLDRGTTFVVWLPAIVRGRS